MFLTADYLLGRRFEFRVGRKRYPDLTCTGFDPEKQRVRVHMLDGGKHWLPLSYVKKAIQQGLWVESATEAPFTVPDTRRQKH